MQIKKSLKIYSPHISSQNDFFAIFSPRDTGMLKFQRFHGADEGNRTGFRLENMYCFVSFCMAESVGNTAFSAFSHFLFIVLLCFVLNSFSPNFSPKNKKRGRNLPLISLRPKGGMNIKTLTVVKKLYGKHKRRSNIHIHKEGSVRKTPKIQLFFLYLRCLSPLFI